jgi:SAM-dependent methyltransferase
MVENLPTPRNELNNVRPGLRGSGLGRRRNQIAMLEQYGFQPSSQVLEIGCGVGWLAYDLASLLDSAGGYAGLDVSGPAIEWLDANYASRLPNFRFDLLDVKSKSYRPRGTKKSEDIRFPHNGDRFDIVCSFNVFMYLTQAGIANYLRETARVLRSGGVGVLTLKAVIDADARARVGSSYKKTGDGVYAPRDGWAMAYDDSLIRSMIDRAGLDVHAFEMGAWHKEPSAPKSKAASTVQPGPDLYVVTSRKELTSQAAM